MLHGKPPWSMGICRFILVKAASFLPENWRFWSGLRDLNPRSLGPKPSAIPNFAKPGYSVGVFSDVVKHVVKGYFRPERGRSQGEKVLVPQRVFGLSDSAADLMLQLPNQAPYQLGHTRITTVLYRKNGKKA